VKVYLVELNDSRRIFYSEPEAVVGETPARGLRAWFQRSYLRLQEKIHTSESVIGPHVRQVWNWLHRRTFPDEASLIRLRSAIAIEVHHPASIGRDEALRLWSRYLASRRRRHLFWLVLNVLVSPVTMLLTIPLPGPNIIGYWFGFRCVCHLLSLLGISRARKTHMPTSFHPSELLDAPSGESDGEHMARVAERCGLRGLTAFFESAAEQQVQPDDTPFALAFF